MEQSMIYVLSISGQPLMPTRRHNKVWYWLRRGLAKVVRREPFTIQLCFETSTHTQPVSVGVDTGSKTVGVAATTNGEVVYQAEVHLRTDISEKMTQRRIYRRNRRARKTRYRAARFANRRRQAGWLAPSLRSKAHANDAVAIACEMGKQVKLWEEVYQMRCLPRGQYQRFNGHHSEHKCWAPRKVGGFKLYEVVKAKGVVGYIGGRREKGAFLIKEVSNGKKLIQVVPNKLERVARPTQGWMITRKPTLEHLEKEGGASSLS